MMNIAAESMAAKINSLQVAFQHCLIRKWSIRF